MQVCFAKVLGSVQSIWSVLAQYFDAPPFKRTLVTIWCARLEQSAYYYWFCLREGLLVAVHTDQSVPAGRFLTLSRLFCVFVCTVLNP